jgi:integrase
MTFGECATAYIEAHRAGWRNPKHAAQWSSTLNAYALPVMGKIPVADVDVGLVMKVVEPLWTTKTETAGRVRGRIEAVLDWASARGYRAGDNPARWRGHLDKLLPAKAKVRKVKHHAALPYDELPAFIVAARTNETIGAPVGEINAREKLWTIPADRMKAERDHRVPLTARALAIVAEVAPADGSLFPGGKAGRTLSNMAMTAVLKRMGRGDITVHGFRSTFRDWAAERTNFPSEVVEMALAHTIEDKVEAAYRRGDLFQKRRRLMDAWAEFCAAPREGRVVQLTRASSAAAAGG